MTLSLNLLVAGLKYVNSMSVYFYFNKNLYAINFRFDLSNGGMKYTSFGSIVKKHQVTVDQYIWETVNKNL